jgi:hypothetical protein
MKIQFIFLVFIVSFFSGSAIAQISQGGLPPGIVYHLPDQISEINIRHIDDEALHMEDTRRDETGEPFRFAVTIKTDLSPSNSGTWDIIAGQTRIWRLKINSQGALALGLYYDKFHLPAGSKLFLYNDDKTQVIGAFTIDNNTPEGLFATELIRGSSVILEYSEPISTSQPVQIHVSEVAHAYRGVGILSNKGIRGFGDSGSCEVNINCSEGQSWQDAKRGVVRISVKNGSSLFWCTGSLVNNTSHDYSPYLLTADHCGFYSGEYVSPQDLNQWIFYFNYEAENCSEPVHEPPYQTMTGASLIAHGGETGNTGSDFFLLLLNQNVPGTYNPYFIGWNNQNAGSQSGVSIHHPQGDIKKVSTYTSPTLTTQWNGNGLQSHWKVTWNETANGHGVTEGGSSGAPLLDNEGYIIGTLTGGESSCTNLNSSDFFGKLSWHWESNGTTPDKHLKEWLDPENTGTHKWTGTFYGNITVANFTTDTSIIPIGGRVNFSDLSAGLPDTWKWTFEGGDPASSTDQNPSGIIYDTYGFYDVKLIITNDATSDTLLRKDYIKVIPVISPNPSRGEFKVFLGKNVKELPGIRVFSLPGEEVLPVFIHGSLSEMRISLENARAGFYLLKIASSQSTIYSKIILIK